ncbi:hypothetical protein LTR27_004472 [Elasticomyces elasticus]|nr:hypothetical protein LTR27_004472 [Elasticomyces elasticus]
MTRSCYKTAYRFFRRPKKLHFVQFEAYRMIDTDSFWGKFWHARHLRKPWERTDVEAFDPDRSQTEPYRPAICHVGIHDKPEAIPPQEQVAKGQWEYKPVPLTGRPISNERFLHYLLHPQKHAPSVQAVYLARIAKKLRESAIERAQADQNDEIGLDWGLHIIEEPDAMVFACLGLVDVVMGLTISLIVGSFAQNYSQGFGVGCGSAALVATYLVYLYNLLKDSEHHGKSA